MQEPPQKSTLENLVEEAGAYLETRLELLALQASEKAANISGLIVTVIVVLAFLLPILLFAGFGMAIWLAGRWGNPVAAYFAVAGFFTLILGVTLLVAVPLVRAVIIRRALESLDDDEEQKPE